GHADLASAVDGAALDGDVVAVLDEDRVVAVVRQIDVADDHAPGLGDAEDAASAAARDDVAHPDVRVIAAVGLLAVVVGHAEGRVTGAGADVGAVDGADPSVGGVLDQQSGLAHVAGGDPADLESVDVPRLHRVAVRAGDVDVVHGHVG